MGCKKAQFRALRTPGERRRGSLVLPGLPGAQSRGQRRLCLNVPGLEGQGPSRVPRIVLSQGRAAGRLGAPRPSLQPEPRLPPSGLWSSHLWENPARGSLAAVLRPTQPHSEGRPSSPQRGRRSWGTAETGGGLLRPAASFASRARALRTTGGGCFPFTARTPQPRRASAAAPACVREAAPSPSNAEKGDRQENWKGPSLGLAAPQNLLSGQLGKKEKKKFFRATASPLPGRACLWRSQPGACARIPHPPPAGKRGARKVSGGEQEFLKGSIPTEVSEARRRTWAGRRSTYSCRSRHRRIPSSPCLQMAGGIGGRLPRAACADRCPRARQAPPGSVHASPSCGAWRGDVRRARRAPVSAVWSAAR